MDAVGVPSLMPRTIDQINAEHGQYLLRKVLSETQPGETVGLLGLSYKPGTPVIERSFGVDLAGWLAAEGRGVIGWDPLAMGEARKVLGDVIAYAPTRKNVCRNPRVAIVINPMKRVRRHRLVGSGEDTGARSVAVPYACRGAENWHLRGAWPRQ